MTSPDPFWLGPIGVDVSMYQGKVNWASVKNAGYDFALIKATEGVGSRDPRFVDNWIAARDAGLLVGAWHFARVSKKTTIEADAKDEAGWFASQILAQPHDVMLPPGLDIEWDKKADKIIKGAEVVRWCQVFTQHVREITGRTPVVYTGFNFWRWRLLKTQSLSVLPLWQVHYTSNTAPRSIPGWKWTFWQWSHTQILPGSKKTKVDANRFNGTLEQLQALAEGKNETADDPFRTEPEPVVEIPWWEKLQETLEIVNRAIFENSRRGG
jgi:lysozyme